MNCVIPSFSKKKKKKKKKRKRKRKRNYVIPCLSTSSSWLSFYL